MEGLIGHASAAMAAVIIQPVDLIKVKYQVNSINGIQSPLTSVVRDLYKKEGVRGFFSGVISRLSTRPTFYMVYFQAEDMIKKSGVSFTNHWLGDKMVTSYLASGIGATIANPLCVMTTKMQANNMGQSVSLALRTLYRESGSSFIFKGLPATMINNFKLTIQFPLTDVMREDYGCNSFTSALIGKTIPTSLFYPMDLIRTSQRNTSGNLSMIQVAKIIKAKYGIRGFYRGIGVYCLVSVPEFVLLNVFRDAIKGTIAKNTDEQSW